MNFARLLAALAVGGVALLAQGAAEAAIGDGRGPSPTHAYTDHPSRVSTGRTVTLYVDRDFSPNERQSIVSAVRQWNHVLNGFLKFRANLLPEDASRADLAQIKRNGGWIVAKVDSRHPITSTGEGRRALAVTSGGSGGGFVYVIADRIGNRDLTGVVMHEFGHVLGAGHSRGGLMAPVYSATTGHCIDREAAALIASAQRLPVQQMNWCEAPGYDPRSRPRSAMGDGWR